jgi:hypothetical protein
MLLKAVLKLEYPLLCGRRLGGELKEQEAMRLRVVSLLTCSRMRSVLVLMKFAFNLMSHHTNHFNPLFHGT